MYLLLQPKKSQTEHQLVKGRKVCRFSAGKTESHCLLVIPFSRCNVQASGLSPVVRALVKLTKWHVLSNQPSFQLERSARVRLIQRRGRVSIRFKYYKIVRQHGLTMVDIWILMNVGSSIFQCSSLQPPGFVPVLIHPAVCGSLDVNLLHLSRLGLVVRTSMQHSIGVPLVSARSQLRKHRTGRTDGCNICCMFFVHLVEYKSSWIQARHSYTKIVCVRLSGNFFWKRHCWWSVQRVKSIHGPLFVFCFEEIFQLVTHRASCSCWWLDSFSRMRSGGSNTTRVTRAADTWR